MSNRRTVYFISLVLFILTGIFAGIIWYQQKQELKVVFLDVGQGDATLIMQGSRQVLIDGGPDGGKTLEKLGEYIPFWDREIEIVIATHPDQDHISGLIDVMKTYRVGELIDNSEDADSQVYKKYRQIIEEKNISRLRGQKGMHIEMGNGANLDILSPDENLDNNPKDTNADSIVAKLTYGENNFLFTGDLPAEKEQELMNKNADLKSKVIKIAHHGSKYSASNEFLDYVNPIEVVISVGKNNRYGHPAQETLDRINAHKIMVKRTDEGGDIEYDF